MATKKKKKRGRAPVLVLGVVIIGIVYFMKKRNDKK